MPVLIAAIAIAHACAFIQYQRRDWTTHWSDQEGYRRLGAALAQTGRFTRYPNEAAFVPEVLRTPGYPVFVAAIYRLFGVSQLAVVIAQAVVFGLLTLLVYHIARRVTAERVAMLSALAVALYAPIPYFSALMMTELWTTFVLTSAMLFAIRASQRAAASDFVLAGILFGYAALCRPVFVLLPICMAAVGAGLSLRESRERVSPWLVLLGAAVLACIPWFAYNYHYFHRITISPAGGIGRATWEGSWQGTWPDRIQATLTKIADRDADRVALDDDVTRFAGVSSLQPEPMLAYVHQWQDIRKIWTTPTESKERARARVDADREYWRVGLQNIRAHPVRWLTRRLSRGLFALWATDTPIRYSDIDSVPPTLVHLIWLAQLAVDVLAIVGLVSLAHAGHPREAALLATSLLYVTLVHFPLLTEGRQSLPTKPVVIMLSVIAVSALSRHKPAGRQPIRILHIITWLGVGGAERSVLTAATGLPRTEFETAVCCFIERGHFADEAEKQGIKVWCLNEFPSLRHPHVLYRLYRVIRAFRPDIVHTHLQAPNLYGRLMAMLARVPVVVASEHNVYSAKARRHIFVERLLARRTAALIAQSETVRQFLGAQLGICSSAIQIVRYGIAPEQPSPERVEILTRRLALPPDRVVLGTVASLTPKKGHVYLLQALALLRERGVYCSLVLAGDGSERATLEALAVTLGISDLVHFLGVQTQVSDVLALIDVFVLSSLTEGVPLALLEAMFAEKPVVATAVGGVPEVIVSGINGILVEPRAVHPLADAIQTLVANPGLWRQYGTKARATVMSQFTKEQYLLALSSLYLTLLGTSDGAGFR